MTDGLLEGSICGSQEYKWTTLSFEVSLDSLYCQHDLYLGSIKMCISGGGSCTKVGGLYKFLRHICMEKFTILCRVSEKSGAP